MSPLAEIRSRIEGAVGDGTFRWTDQIETADLVALLAISDAAEALLTALYATGEADCAYAIRRWVQADETDLHRDERPIYAALTALAEKTGWRAPDA